MPLWRKYGILTQYLALKTIIESNGWCVELFVVEVGSRGYCSISVLCCFKKLGFSNTLTRNTIKKLSKSSMECSFCIWLARNNKDWTPSTANCHLNDPSKETCNSPSSVSSLKQTIKPVSNTKWIRPVGIKERKHMLCKFHLEGLKCCVKPLEQSPLRIKHIIANVTSYQSRHDCKKESNQTCWSIQLFMGLKT